ncbi:hypothetical protein A0U96_01955 [Lactiplantibacillus plantarum]|nr:hypothetical protein A0U96_01955 [Lactiplantibacillus plantarum]
MISTITLDTYKQQISSGDAFNLSDSFNGRVGDEQVPLVAHFKERGLAQRFEDGLVPFLTGFVGSLDENDQVTAETGEAVSYVGTSDDIVGLGRVKMNLPGTMFPQEGYFYGFLGLQNADGKRVTTFNIWFHVYNGNPDMFVNKAPFRSELQKLLDESEQLISKTDGAIQAKLIEWQNAINKLIADGNADLDTYKQRVSLAEDQLNNLAARIATNDVPTKADLASTIIKINNQVETKMAEVVSASDLATLVSLDNYYTDGNTQVGGPVPNYISSKYREYIQKLKNNTDDVLLGFITDDHYQSGNYAPNSLEHYSWFAGVAREVSPDGIIVGGDNINGDLGYSYNQSAYKRVVATLNGQISPETPVFWLVGNHDSGNGQSGNTPATVILSGEMKQYFNTKNNPFGETRANGSLYFYKDLNDKKLRVIGLDGFDLPEQVDSNGTLHYDTLMQGGYQQDQINFLANALKLPANDWKVIVFCHIPLSSAEASETLLDPSTNVRQYNDDLVRGILNAFEQGTNYAGDNTKSSDLPASISVDYTNQGKGSLIGEVTGHMHTDANLQWHGINFVTRNKATALSYYASDIARQNSINETSFDFIGINYNAHRMTFYRFGFGEDLTVTY